jgi:enoyl-CoA hydratase
MEGSGPEGPSIGHAVLTERRGRVLLITLNRPEAMNSINGALARGLAKAVSQLDEDAGLTVGVLAGAGRGFSSGMDLKAFARGEDIAPAVRFLRHGARKPLIAAVEGFALAGGFELALACDLIVAAAGVRLGIPEVKVGLFAAGGGVLRLPSRAGYAKAMEMAITGDPITAEEATGLGLVTRVTEPGRAVEAAMEIAGRVARNAPLAVAAAKEMIKAAQGVTETEFWAIQGPRQAAVFASNDAKEGPRAFAEKREPDWTGT